MFFLSLGNPGKLFPSATIQKYFEKQFLDPRQFFFVQMKMKNNMAKIVEKIKIKFNREKVLKERLCCLNVVLATSQRPRAQTKGKPVHSTD